MERHWRRQTKSSLRCRAWKGQPKCSGPQSASEKYLPAAFRKTFGSRQRAAHAAWHGDVSQTALGRRMHARMPARRLLSIWLGNSHHESSSAVTSMGTLLKNVKEHSRDMFGRICVMHLRYFNAHHSDKSILQNPFQSIRILIHLVQRRWLGSASRWRTHRIDGKNATKNSRRSWKRL